MLEGKELLGKNIPIINRRWDKIPRILRLVEDLKLKG